MENFLGSGVGSSSEGFHDWLMARPRLQPNARDACRDAAHRRRIRVDEQAITLDSDLFVDMEIMAEELHAIARLLGDDFKGFLSEF
ncbi:MAG TPA: hypothetical protein VK681_33585 [Reyranella sp.]|jgi:hypothetical protein|nr:hypothetical protein [Reyranella sp.]